MDDDYDLRVNQGEFRRALRDYKIALSEEELKALFNYLDTEHTGKVPIDAIINSLRSEMSSFRKNIVTQAFKKLDRQNHGYITVPYIFPLHLVYFKLSFY
jgi:Ca2+-binding EF-hand superfamily protein